MSRILLYVLSLIFTIVTSCSNKQDYGDIPNNVVMDESEFWNVISMFEWKFEVDDDRVLNSAINYLSKKSNEDIYKFHDILSRLLYDLDGIEYAQNIGQYSYKDKNSHFSVDWFLYTRCVVVANGRDYYYKIINNPKEMPKDLEFESLLYIAYDAYEKKNNKEFNYISKYSFETFSNKDNWKTIFEK
ncbi:hypothetical protein AN1V17_16400 [Vallitalea sediminicola]